ncbi:phosphoglycerate dehydrogenase-like enzyme [Microbacterium resistens]|uniref:Phosphoglycerate dehydrogenase-like enzyme n=1 Tax=Microbacterium resistens TaxID=156977 RepID=A0ABU1SBT2_9MICO|nr:hydroxyacid dehydrogenase [Microbacterium resistens]MDR6867084.1 phosphoglycerate dehydrogenase-like enzyme [Microbacterium resistens]
MSAPTVLAVVSAALAAEFFSPADEARLRETAAALGGGFLRVERLADAEDTSAVRVLVTSWGIDRLDEDVLARFPRLGLVAHTGATVKPFVTDALFERGVVVTQAGAGMARSVGEVSLAFTLALLHRVPTMHNSLRDGPAWHDEGSAGVQHEILDAPIAVIGASRTGRAYLAMIRALGARPLLVDPTIGAEEAAELGAEPVGLDEALRRALVVAVHAPTLPETHHLIGARELALLPDGAGLVNTARSWLVDEQALLAELRTGRIAAGIDVFDEEPLGADSPFRRLPNVLLTPHRAAGTREGRLRQGRIVAEEVEAFALGRPLAHAVTRSQLSTMG